MPLYEYECKQCHRRLEKIQSFSAPPEKVCPKCSGELERVISAPAIQFKGAGWYVNDYAKSGAKPATDGKKADAKPDGTSEGGTESKSEKKSDGGKDSGGGSSAAASSDSSSSSSGANASNSSAAPASSGSVSSGKSE